MPIQYVFEVTGARVVEESGMADVIKQLDYTLTGTDMGCSFSLPASAAFGPPDEDAFVEFDDLTPEQLTAWIESVPETEAVKQHVAYVVAKAVEKSTLAEKPLPWAPTPALPDPAPPTAPEAPTEP
jgi:hypothetical protein